MAALGSLILVVVILILVVLVDIAVQQRRIYGLLSRPHAKVAFPITPHSHKGAQQVAAFSVWAFKEGCWSLVAQCGQAGCECEPPPQRSGKFEGEVVRKECLGPASL